MSGQCRQAAGMHGGLRAHAGGLRGWTRDEHGRLVSKPVRCRHAEWYLARALPLDGAAYQRVSVLTMFLRAGEVVAERCLRLHAVKVFGGGVELLGWIQTPGKATHLRLCAADAALPQRVAGIAFYNVSERDPKCHPLANVPRWSVYRPPFAIQRIVLPAVLGGLARLLEDQEVQIAPSPASLVKLGRLTRGAAAVIDPHWVTDLKLTLADLERLASSSWLLVDLETTARVLGLAGAAAAELVTYSAANGTMSARVEYADVPTRGLALQDVVPYTTLDARRRFGMRAIKANGSWKRYADEVGFATLLSAETPWERKHGDVLSAVRAVGGGELLATDLPWLVAGEHGSLLAPRIAAHLLRMHLAAPLQEHMQYWNRWAEGDVMVRDISALAECYPPLRAVQWASADARLAHLGISLAPAAGPVMRHVLVRTGRIDNLDVHDGLPPEPMMIFMKWLAREAREQTEWARRHLAGTSVTWQFDSADGLKYAAQFDAAELPAGVVPEVVRLRLAGHADKRTAGADREVIAFEDDGGLHGDGSLDFQDALTNRLRRVIERARRL